MFFPGHEASLTTLDLCAPQRKHLRQLEIDPLVQENTLAARVSHLAYTT